MKTPSYLVKVICALLLLYLQSCQKVLDRILDPANGPQTKCAIAKIIRSEEDVGTITYNAAGDPVTVTYTDQGYDYNWHYFKYDDHERLQEYRVELQPGLDIELHRYAYDESNRVIGDTGTFMLTGYIVILSTFEYDSRNRIIKENQEIIDIEEGSTPSEIDPVSYQYDERGNLVNPFPPGDPVTYDDKISFRRTNKVWMLIERNYSLNNVTGVSGYNEHSLPLTFANYARFLGVSIIGIEYECE